jgi:SAM-dependent methyltransferase
MGRTCGAARVKGILQRVPGLALTYRHARLLSSVAYERWWLELQQRNDRAILNGEWHFETDAEQQRYHSVLSAVGRLRGPAAWGDVLEIGCAEGLFTREVVERSNSVTAYDVSPIACERAALAVPGARVRRLDVSREAIEGTFDIVFLMCVLGTLHGRRTLRRVSANIARAVRPGGLLIFNELRFHDARIEGSWWARALVEGGLELVKFLDGRDGLRLIHQEDHRGHVIGIYEKLRVFSSPAHAGKS